MIDPLASNQIDTRLEQYMNLLSARQRVVSSNIANADTPGYKTLDIDFQSEMQMAGSALNAAPNEVRGLRMKSDGNNVNLDREARLLAENAMRFSVASNLVRSQVQSMKLAIDGGTTTS